MIALTRQDVLAHQREPPGPSSTRSSRICFCAWRCARSSAIVFWRKKWRCAAAPSCIRCSTSLRPFTFSFRGETVSTKIASFNIDEMLATKMRAMLQRRKGRDLFDLYWALTAHAAQPVDLERVLAALTHYMGAEGTSVSRAEFIAHVEECLADRAGFCTDMTDLLRVGVAYAPLEART